jgi:hypothetical protein
MQAILIVELKIRFEPAFCIRDRPILLEIDFLLRDASPESFDEHSVQGSAATIPTDANLRCLQASSKRGTGQLRSLLVVKHLRSRLLQCLFERFQTKGGFGR